MRLFLIRHGESTSNVDKTWTGWMDVALTEKGKKDAEKAGEFLSLFTFDKVYASDLSRAVQTANIALPGRNVETTPLLREINVGMLGGKPGTSVTIEERNQLAASGFVKYGGESREAFLHRAECFLKMVEERGDQTVAAFSHAGMLHAMVTAALGFRSSGGKVLCSNCTVLILEHDGMNWWLRSWIDPHLLQRENDGA